MHIRPFVDARLTERNPSDPVTVALRDIVDHHTNDSQDDSDGCDGCGVDVTGTAAKRLATCPELRAIAAIWETYPNALDHIRREVPSAPMYRVHNFPASVTSPLSRSSAARWLPTRDEDGEIIYQTDEAGGPGRLLDQETYCPHRYRLIEFCSACEVD